MGQRLVAVIVTKCVRQVILDVNVKVIIIVEILTIMEHVQDVNNMRVMMKLAMKSRHLKSYHVVLI